MHSTDERILRRYYELLTDEVTPDQAARLAEKWELICAEQGWLYLPEAHLPAPPCALTQQEEQRRK